MPANDIILTFIARVSGFINGVSEASRSIGQFGQSLQQIGVQLGILSIQFEQFSKLVVAGIRPILDEGIKLQAALDEVRSVAPDLNAKFQRFTRTTLSTSQAVGEVADALKGIAGVDVVSGVEKAAEGLENFTTNSDEARKFLANLTEEFRGSGPEIGQFNRRIAELTASGANFTQALRTLAAERNFDALKEQIVSLAETTKFTAIEVAEASKFLALAGFNAAEIRQALPEVLNLAAAGSLDLGRASDIATNSLLAFRLEAFSLNRVVDTLAFTAAQSNTSVEQLGNAFRYAAPFASALGFSVEETAAALGKLGDVGIQATSAGNSLANAFRALAKRGDNFDAVLGELGLTLSDVDPQFNSLVDILRAFERAGATTNQIIRAFSIRGGRAVASLINQGIDELEALQTAIETADFSALDVAATRIENVAGQLLLLRSQLSAIASSVFDTIESDVEKFLSFVSELLRNVREFIKENPAIAEAIVKISVFAAAASAAIAGLLVLISGPVSLAGIIALFVAFGAEILTAGAALAAFAAALVPTLVAFGATAAFVFDAIRENVRFFRDAIILLGEVTKTFVAGFKEGFLSVTVVLGEFTRRTSEELQALVLSFSALIKQVIGGREEFHSLGQAAGVAVGSLVDFFSAVTSFGSSALLLVVEGLRLLYATLRIGISFYQAFTHAVIASSKALSGNAVAAARELKKVEEALKSAGRAGHDYLDAFDPKGIPASVIEQVLSLQKLLDVVKEVNAEFRNVQKSSSRLVELLQDFQVAPLKSVEELLEGIREKQDATGSSNFLEVLQVESDAAKKKLAELNEEKDKLLAGGAESPEAAIARNSLDREIDSLQRLVDTYEEQKKAIQQFSEESGLSVAEFERAVSARFELLKAQATDLGREFEFLNQKVGDLRKGNQDLRLEFDLEELKRSGKEFEANIKQLRESSTAEIKELSQEIVVQQKIIDATLEQLLIERTATNEANLVREVEKIRELNERKILLEKKLQSELAELQKKENERKAKEAEKAAEEAAKAAKKAADEEAKRQDLLRDLEIDALRAQGKEKLAIEAEYQRDREEAEKRFQDLGLQGAELAEARANVEIKLAKDRKDALARLNGEQERRVENSKKAADFENDVFKSLLGEVKTARDLVVLFVLLNQLRIARFKIANQAARGALSANEQLLKIESRIDRARENGNAQAVKALGRQRDLLAIRAGLLEANATNLARALGADRIIDIFNLDSLRDRVENQGAEIFANAPKSWAEAFTAAFPPQAARMIAQVQAFVLQIRQIMQNAAPNIGAAAAGVANFQPGVAQAAAQFPDVAANFNRAFGVGGAAAGLGGAVGNAAPAPARAGGGNVPVNRIVNINVNNAQDVDKVKRAIAQEVNRAGFRVGDI